MNRNLTVSLFTFAVLALLAAAPAHAQFSANPATLVFPNTAIGANPNVAFFIVNSSATTNILVATSPAGSWLTATVSGNTTPAQVTVTVNPSILSNGTYNGSVTVSSTTGIPSPLTVPVQLVVGGGGSGSGLVNVSPTSLTFNSANNFPQTLSITTSTAATYSATASTFQGTGWLSVNPNFGGPSQFSTTQVSVNPAGLLNGTYQGSVTISANGGSQVIPVTLNVGTSGSGNVTPQSLSYNYVVGGTFPGSQIITYTPTATTTISATAVPTTGSGWLSVTPSSSGFTSSPTSFSVSVNPSGLTPNTYTGNIFLVPGTGTTATVPVTLVVSPTGGGGGNVTFSPSSFNFTYNVGGFTATQNLSLNSINSFSYNVTASYISGNGWLTLGNNSGATNSANVTVGVQPASLATGTYQANLSVNVNGAIIGNIPVTLTVNGGGGGTGQIFLSPNSFNFNYPPGQSFAAAQAMNMTAPIGTTFSASASTQSGTGWLTVTPPFGATNASLTQFSVNVNPGSLPTGTYTGTVTVSTGAGTATASVVMTVGGGGGGGTGGVTLSPGSLVFSLVNGQVPQSQTLTLITPSPSTFTATATSTPSNWLAVGPNSSTTVTPGGGGSPAAQLIAGIVNPGSLANGTYTGTITVSTPTGSATTNVTLNVGTGGGGGATTGSVSPSSLAFTYQSGGTLPPAQLLGIATTNGVSGTFTATPNGNSAFSWLSATPLSGNAPGAVAISVNPQSLPAGTYNGSVSILLGGTGSPISVPVSLLVSPNPVLRTNIGSANFNYQIGGTVSAGQSQSVDLSSTGTALTVTTSATTNTGQNWLFVSPQSLSTPSSVTVSINATGLPAGTYTGNVFFNTNQGQTTFPVTLTVSASPLVNASPAALAFNSPAGTGSPGAQVISVSTTGNTVSLQATAVTTNGGTSWLSVSPTNSSSPTSFTVSVNQAGLGQDTYYGAIVINTNGQTANGPLVIPVVYTNGSTSGGGGGGGTGPLNVNPASLTFAQVPGGSAPAAQTVNVSSNAGFVTFSASASTQSGGSWLNVSPITGTTPGSITVSVNGSGLALGTYTGFIVVTATSGVSATQVIQVTLSVVNSLQMTATPTSLSFDYQVGGTSSPGPQTISLATASGSGIPFNVTSSTSSGGSWLSVSPISGNTPGSLTVSASPSGLPLGTYTGSITVTSAATNSPLTIPVTFTVRQRSQILSQIADGASWKTTITLVNLDSVPAPYTLRFYGDNGTDLQVATDASVGRVSSIDGTLPVGGSRTISTLGTDSALSQGWAELSTARTINGTAVFRQRVERDQEGSVALTSSLSRFVMAFDNVDGLVTSMAILNTNASQTITVSLIIRDENGVQLGTDSIVMTPRQHLAFALTDRLPATRGRRGNVEFSTAGTDITGLGLRFNPSGAFTSFPILPK